MTRRKRADVEAELTALRRALLPTRAFPGSQGKIEVLRGRASLRLQLFIAGDLWIVPDAQGIMTVADAGNHKREHLVLVEDRNRG